MAAALNGIAGCHNGSAMTITSIPPLEDRPLTDAERLAVLDRADEILELTYRSATLGNYDDPLEEAVYIVLSRQTQEVSYQRTYAELRRRWPSWEALHQAPHGDLVAVLTPSGFGRSRARELRGLLDGVAAACAARGMARLNLDWLHDLTDEEAQAFLLTLPGISIKSARCVLHYSLDRQVLAVDTHVRRVLDRMGIVGDPGGKVKHDSYDAAVPARLRQRMHVNLIHHGRAICRAQAPRCGQCPLVSFCPKGRAELAAASDETARTAGNSAAASQPVAVELFAGGGGLGEGFTRAGFHVAIAVEWDRPAAQTYRINHPGTVVVETDATAITAKQIAFLSPHAAAAEAIIGGPPCQGYSMAGKRKADDEKNVLYRAVIALAEEMKPRFVVIENVPGMRHVEGRSFVASINDALREAGYDSDAHLLRACDYGVPQLRRRMLFIAQRADAGPAPARPASTHCPGNHCPQKCGKDNPGANCGRTPTPTVLDTLYDLPTLPAGQIAEYLELSDGSYLLNGSTMDHSQRVIDKIEGIAAGSGPISYRRLHDDIARTIVAGHRALPVHPVLHRTLSVREAARIQGFGDDHVFCGKRSQQPLQVANAVPPQLAEVVALTLLDACKGDPAAASSGLREPAEAPTEVSPASSRKAALSPRARTRSSSVLVH